MISVSVERELRGIAGLKIATRLRQRCGVGDAGRTVLAFGEIASLDRSRNLAMVPKI